jgi:hypothetical protein
VRDGPDGKLLLFCFARCAYGEIVRELKRRGLIDAQRPLLHVRPLPSHDDAGQRRDLARWLWSQRRPLRGTPAERYLQSRSCGAAFPQTLGYLPGRGAHADALIAAFGFATEPQPGFLDASAVQGVQLVKLTADAAKVRDGSNPITIGRCMGVPIILAPMNDLLGLAVTEGVEDGLSVALATGLGVWAAGGAGRLAALAEAVPTYTDCITIVADDDSAGGRGALALFDALRHRGFADVRMGAL